MNQLEQTFNQKKAEFEQETAKFHALKAQKEKIEKTISAFKNEQKETIETGKNLIASGEISEDEYLDLINKNTGIKARIEYQQAKLEDLEEKIYQQAELVKTKRYDTISAREAIFAQNAKENFDQWLNENKAILNKFFTDFYYSGMFRDERGYLNSTFSDEKIMKYMMDKISAITPEFCSIDQNLRLENPLKYFEFRTPAQTHKKHYDTTPKGFEKLLDNLK